MTAPATTPATPATDPIAAELAAVRARREQLAAEREARAAPTAAQQLAEEKRRLTEDEAIAKAEQDFGPIDRAIAVVRSELGAIVLKRAHQANWRKYVNGDTAKYDHIETLVRSCLVYPSREEFDQIASQLPGIVHVCGFQVQALAGIKAADTAVK